MTGNDGERDAQNECRRGQPQNDGQLHPERLGSFLPGFGLAAGFEQAQAGIDPLRQPQLVQDLWVLFAEAFEVGRALQR